MKNILIQTCLILLIAIALADDCKAQGIEIRIDPRIELLAVIQYLSDYDQRTGLITDYEIDYKHDVEEYFSEFRDHEAVRLFDQMSRWGFNFDGPPAAMLYLSNPPELKPVIPFGEYVIGRAGGEEKLNEFVGAMREFARESDFMAFFEKHGETFESVRDDIQKKMEDINYAATLEDYYGLRREGYIIIPAMLFHAGGFGPRLEYPDGRREVYSICGPQGIKKGLPDFGDRERFEYLAWHEFSHSFVNPMTGEFIGEVNEYIGLYAPIASKMKEMAYGSWESCVNEHIVRAVTSRLAAIHKGPEQGLVELAKERRKGFAYVDSIYYELIRYENSRDRFPSLADFYPEILNLFKRLDSYEMARDFYYDSFAGPISAVSKRGANVLIVPTGESDSVAQRMILEYVEQVRNRFYEEAPILHDTSALKADLSDYNIVVYGTIAGNLWLRDMAAELEFEIYSDSIILDSVYHGNALRFITCWPNPENRENGLLIYTAQRAGEIYGINRVYHGPDDYVIAKDRQELGTGNYIKEDQFWRLAE